MIFFSTFTRRYRKFFERKVKGSKRILRRKISKTSVFVIHMKIFQIFDYPFQLLISVHSKRNTEYDLLSKFNQYSKKQFLVIFIKAFQIF